MSGLARIFHETDSVTVGNELRSGGISSQWMQAGKRSKESFHNGLLFHKNPPIEAKKSHGNDALGDCFSVLRERPCPQLLDLLNPDLANCFTKQGATHRAFVRQNRESKTIVIDFHPIMIGP